MQLTTHNLLLLLLFVGVMGVMRVMRCRQGCGAALSATRRRTLSFAARIPRLKVVMDIDECMIHTFDMQDERRQDEERGKVHADIDGLTTTKLKCEDGLSFRFHVRPGLPEYLQMVKEIADVYAFTAAMSIYARPVINYIDPNQDIFQGVWYRDSCTIKRFEYNQIYTKDLTAMRDEFDPNRTVLVDNNILSFIPQPTNGILIPSFYDDPKDKMLPAVLNILKELENERDIKPALHDLFDLTSHVHNTVKNM